MIPEKFVDLYARNSGVRDKLVAERDVVLTYALGALVAEGVMGALAFKGGTCLRKLVFGSSGRFSEDLDFTIDTDGDVDDVLQRVLGALDHEHFGITFRVGDFYKSDGDTSLGGVIRYRHEWNQEGKFGLDVSLRERPTLPVRAHPLEHQSYFPWLEFQVPAVRRLDVTEMAAEKLRATFQRAKVRDLYDLHRFTQRPFDPELLRRLVVLELWQVQDPFSPERLFGKIRGEAYDWDDLRKLLRVGEKLDPEAVVASVAGRLRPLANLTPLELEVVADARSGRNEALAERL
jgi:predicted nucleotidyltransferase component of viral defense system